jgi:hypothetical protein
MTHDAPHVRVVADVLGGTASGDDQRDVAGRVDIAERDVGGPRVAELLGVGVEVVDEVVDDELELLHRRCGDVDLVTLLQQPLVGVHDL